MNGSNEAGFTGRIKGPGPLRIGVVLGAGAALLLTAVVAMAASPSPSPSTNGSGTAPGASNAPKHGQGWQGPRGMMGGPGMMNGRGFGQMMAGKGPMGGITITAIDGSSLSLRTTDGWTRTITVTGSTTIAKGGSTIALSALKVGDQIVFRETRGSDGSFSITAIDVVLPTIVGDVTAKSGNDLTVKLPDGSTVTVHVSSSTTYKIPGATSPSLSDISVGSRIAAQGTKESDGSLDASAILSAPAGKGGWGPRGGPGFGPKNSSPSSSPTTGGSSSSS